MADYSIAPLAYLKLVLHAAKFPSSTCVGLLVGTFSGSSCTITDAIPLAHHWIDLSPMAEAGLGLVSPITPVWTRSCPFSPHLTFLQADLYAKQQQLVFLGLYVANERLGDQALPHGVQKMAEAVRKDRPDAVVLVVRFQSAFAAPVPVCTDMRRTCQIDNEKLASGEPALVVRRLTRTPVARSLTSPSFLPQPYLPPKSPSAFWQSTTLSSARISLADPSSPTKALEQVRQGRHRLLGDFDEHLEDVRVDWLRNAAVSI